MMALSLLDEAAAINADVGSRIKFYRKSLGLTQADLGRLIGMSFQQVQKFETAKCRLSVSQFVAFSRALGVPPEALLNNAIGMTDTD